MKDYYPLHVKITEEVKKIVKKHKVIFPAYYGQVYAQIAKENNIELSPSELLHKEMLDEKIVHHIISLTECAHLAVGAMKTKNDKLLKKVIEDTTKLQNEIEKLQKVVYEDNLSKCYNRKWFEDKFLEDDNSTFSKEGILIFVDLNRLKRINDSYGHVVGDKVILYLASKLREINPFTLRFGGDEFILLFNESTNIKEIELKMKSILHIFEKSLFKVEDIEFKISFAYGDCHFKKGDLLTTVIDIADKKMYKLKNVNRD